MSLYYAAELCLLKPMATDRCIEGRKREINVLNSRARKERIVLRPFSGKFVRFDRASRVLRCAHSPTMIHAFVRSAVLRIRGQIGYFVEDVMYCRRNMLAANGPKSKCRIPSRRLQYRPLFELLNATKVNWMWSGWTTAVAVEW